MSHPCTAISLCFSVCAQVSFLSPTVLAAEGAGPKPVWRGPGYCSIPVISLVGGWFWWPENIECTPKSTSFCLSVGEVIEISSAGIILCCCCSSLSCFPGMWLGDMVKPLCLQDMVLTKVRVLCCGVKNLSRTSMVQHQCQKQNQVQLLNSQCGMTQTIWLSGVCPPFFLLSWAQGQGAKGSCHHLVLVPGATWA